MINNAGIMRLAPFRDMTDEDFTQQLDVNMKGGFNVLREAARRVRDGGRIVSTSSSITELRTATYDPYAATKAALQIFSSVLAKELGGRMISVNAIAPGVVANSPFLDVPGRTNKRSLCSRNGRRIAVSAQPTISHRSSRHLSAPMAAG